VGFLFTEPGYLNALSVYVGRMWGVDRDEEVEIFRQNHVFIEETTSQKSFIGFGLAIPDTAPAMNPIAPPMTVPMAGL
jgi:hypothetical protein